MQPTTRAATCFSLITASVGLRQAIRKILCPPEDKVMGVIGEMFNLEGCKPVILAHPGDECCECGEPIAPGQEHDREREVFVERAPRFCLPWTTGPVQGIEVEHETVCASCYAECSRVGV